MDFFVSPPDPLWNSVAIFSGQQFHTAYFCSLLTSEAHQLPGQRPQDSFPSVRVSACGSCPAGRVKRVSSLRAWGSAWISLRILSPSKKGSPVNQLEDRPTEENLPVRPHCSYLGWCSDDIGPRAQLCVDQGSGARPRAPHLAAGSWPPCSREFLEDTPSLRPCLRCSLSGTCRVAKGRISYWAGFAARSAYCPCLRGADPAPGSSASGGR